MEVLIGLLVFGFLISKMYEKMGRSSSFLGMFATVFSITWKILSSIFSFMVIGYKRNTYGSAEFLPEWRADFQSKYNDGLSISGTNFIDKETATQHLLAVSPSGGGKTTVIIYPSIHNISYHGSGSMVITDPSSELYLLCKSMLVKRGYKVYRLDLSSPDSDTFNPILLAKTSSEINTLAKTLVTTAMGGLGKDPFWNLSAISLLSILITIQKTLPEEKQTLGVLKEWVTMMAVEELREPIDNLAATNLSTSDYNEYLSFFAQTDKLMQSIIAVCKSIMQNITEDVDKVTKTNTINLDDLRTDKAAIFVSIPEHLQEKLGFVVNLFYEGLFSYLYEMPKSGDIDKNYNYIFLLLDEFANLSIESMTTHITTLRKRRVSMSLIIQSYFQLREKYGNNAQTLIGNCKTKVFFPSLDIDTCESVARSVGITTYVVKQQPFNPFEKGKEQSRQLIQASELRRLKEDSVLVLFGRENPLILKTTPYYKQRSILSALKG